MKVVCDPEGVQIRERARVAAAGERQIEALVRSLGNRYMGTLVVSKAEELSDIGSWFRFLVQFEKPVVWFDRSDEGARIEPFRHRCYFRCHYSEGAFVSAGARFLHDNGHRSVTYAYGPEGGSYQEERLARLVELGTRMSPPLRVRSQCVPGPVSQGELWSADHLAEELAGLEACGNPVVNRAIGLFRKHRREVARRVGLPLDPPRTLNGLGALVRYLQARSRNEVTSQSPYYDLVSIAATALVLLPILSDPTVTAVVAPCDRVAEIYLRWLQSMEIPLPGKISLMSFDNYFRYSYLPITTVDAGFGELAYQAFHLLLRDLPPRRGNPHQIPVRPYVVNNGSVGTVGL
jgi:DNA-binding LacI/PurR family transcriptional regulator